MEFKDTYREKDGGIQVIISVKQPNGRWKQEASKQGFKRQKDAKAWVYGTNGKDGKIDELKKKYEKRLKVDEEFADITLKEFADLFKETRILSREMNTVETLEKAVRHLAPLHEKQIADITTLDAQKIINDMVEYGLKLSTIKLYLSNFRVLFDAAINLYSLIDKNPFSGDLEVSRNKEKRKIKVLDQKEKEYLLDWMRNKAPHGLYVFSLLLANTGMRIGEGIAICDFDICRQNNLLTVNKQWKVLKNGEYGFGALKSINSERDIPVSQNTIDILDEYTASQKVARFDRRIFPMDRNEASQHLSYYFKRSGLNASAHTLRHTFATHLIQNGIDFSTVAALLGDNPKTVVETYVHPTESSMADAKRIIINF